MSGEYAEAEIDPVSKVCQPASQRDPRYGRSDQKGDADEQAYVPPPSFACERTCPLSNHSPDA